MFLSHFLCLLLVSHIGILPIYHARHADCIARSASGALRWFHHWKWSGDSTRHKSIQVKSYIKLNEWALRSLAYDTLCASKALYTYSYHLYFVLTWYKVSSRVKVTKFSVKQICQHQPGAEAINEILMIPTSIGIPASWCAGFGFTSGWVDNCSKNKTSILCTFLNQPS